MKSICLVFIGIMLAPAIFPGCGQANSYDQAYTENVYQDFDLSRHYHEIGELSDGHRFGRTGAAMYLIDEYDKKLSKGFHKISPLPEGGYLAELGTAKFKLDANGKVIEGHYPDDLLPEIK